MTLTIENADKELAKIIKSIAKLTKAKVRISDREKVPSWLKEAQDMQKNPHKYKSYKSVDEMFEDILK
ncbi:hypothetical protein [Helicobacter sp. T3_23-1056]